MSVRASRTVTDKRADMKPTGSKSALLRQKVKQAALDQESLEAMACMAEAWENEVERENDKRGHAQYKDCH